MKRLSWWMIYLELWHSSAHGPYKKLLRTPLTLRKFIFIREKAKMRSSWVETRHQFYYIWHFFGFWTLLQCYPSYDSTGNKNILETTRWISYLMTIESFFDDYQQFYLIIKMEMMPGIYCTNLHLHIYTTVSGK